MSDNESSANYQRLWRAQLRTPFVKDGIHEAVVNRAEGKVNPQGVAPGTTQTVMLRLDANRPQAPFNPLSTRCSRFLRHARHTSKERKDTRVARLSCV